jgi:NAD(P)-dependent dehydrogenase (short-subunit alcohol dehydrogenase family)
MTDNLAMANLFGIRGRSALVTGGTSGIGFMMARGLIINGVGTLFITGYEAEKIVQGKISVLQKLADDVGLECKVSGFAS